MRSGMPSRSWTRARAGADGVLAVRSDGDVQLTTLAEASTTMMVFRMSTSLWGGEGDRGDRGRPGDRGEKPSTASTTSITSPSLLRRGDGAQLLLDLLERAEDERPVVGAAAPEDSHELDVVAARYAEDGRAAVARADDDGAAGIAHEGLAELSDVRARHGGVGAGPGDLPLRPAGRAADLVDDGSGREAGGRVVLTADGEDAADGERAVIGPGRLEDVATVGGDAARVQRARGIAVPALLAPRACAAAEVRRVGDLRRDHPRRDRARRLVVLRPLDAALRVRAVRVGDERAAAAVIDVEAHRAEVLPEVELNAGLRRTEHVAQRGHLVDRLRHLHRVRGGRDAEAGEGNSNPRDRMLVLDAEDELVRALVVIGEHGTGEREHRGRCMSEPAGQPVLALHRQTYVI